MEVYEKAIRRVAVITGFYRSPGIAEDIQRYGDVWVINPGSPTSPRNLQTQLGTVGILRLEERHRADVTIYNLKTLQPYPALTIRLKSDHGI